MDYINGFPYPLTSGWIVSIEGTGRRLGSRRRLKVLFALPQLPPCQDAMGWQCSYQRAQLILDGPFLSATLYGFW